jgi:ABC-type sugar transport system substrate-binding protein
LQGTFDVIFAQNDAMARGISEVLSTAQQRDNVLIIGVDGTGGRDGGIDLVRRGVIDATIWQPMPLETAFSLIQKTANDPKFKPEHRYEREPIAITPRTVDEFLLGAAAGGK